LKSGTLSSGVSSAVDAGRTTYESHTLSQTLFNELSVLTSAPQDVTRLVCVPLNDVINLYDGTSI